MGLGLALAEPQKSIIVITGDGDGLSIGGNHMIHSLRRNVGMKIILFNNEIYGLTKGQYSPTSPLGKVTKSTPMGSVDNPLHPLSIAIGCEASFVARSIDTHIKHLESTLHRAAEHRGTAFVVLCCLLLGAFPELSPFEIKSALRAFASDWRS